MKYNHNSIIWMYYALRCSIPQRGWGLLSFPSNLLNECISKNEVNRVKFSNKTCLFRVNGTTVFIRLGS